MYPLENRANHAALTSVLVAGNGVSRVTNNQAADSEGWQRRLQTRCDFRHSGEYGGTVRLAKNSLNAGSGCRSRSGNGHGLSTTARPPRPCDAACMRVGASRRPVDKPVETVDTRW